MNPSQAIPARHRFPDRGHDTTRLLVMVCGIVAAIAVFATVAAVSLWFRLNHQIDRIDALAQSNRAAAVSTYESRWAASLEACRQREDLKAGLLQILAKFNVTEADLPQKNGVTVLSPIPEGCEAYARRVVPRSSRP